jgi:hypothetical protein
MDDSMSTVDPEVLPHLSASSYDQFARCPAQWAYVRVDGLRLPPGIAAHVGSGLHGAAEADMRQKIVTGVDLPADALADAAVTTYRARLERSGVFLPRDEAAAAPRLLAAGLDRAAALGRAFATEAGPAYRPAAVEEHLACQDPDFPLPWVGTLDLRTADGAVVDWKTAGRRWPAGREHRETQPTVYRQLYRAQAGREPAALSFEVFVDAAAGPTRDPRPTQRTDGDWAALRHGARTMVRMVAAGLFPPAVFGSWWCSPRWCGLWWVCKHIPERLRRLPNV